MLGSKDLCIKFNPNYEEAYQNKGLNLKLF